VLGKSAELAEAAAVKAAAGSLPLPGGPAPHAAAPDRPDAAVMRAQRTVNEPRCSHAYSAI